MEKDVIFDKDRIVRNPYENKLCDYCLNSATKDGDVVCQLWMDWDGVPGRGDSSCHPLPATNIKSCSPHEYRLNLEKIFQTLKGYKENDIGRNS